MTSSDNIALADGMPVLARGMTVLPAELLSKLLTWVLAHDMTVLADDVSLSWQCYSLRWWYDSLG